MSPSCRTVSAISGTTIVASPYQLSLLHLLPLVRIQQKAGVGCTATNLHTRPKVHRRAHRNDGGFVGPFFFSRSLSGRESGTFTTSSTLLHSTPLRSTPLHQQTQQWVKWKLLDASFERSRRLEK